MVDPISREQLDRITGADHDAIRKFEDLFNEVDALSSGIATLIYTVNGTGAVEADANAMDFSGQTGATGTAATNSENDLIYYAHNGLVYLWSGPRPSTIGLNGDYTATGADFQPFGAVQDHGSLQGLGDDDHPQYLNNARGDARYTPLSHASLTNNPHAVTAAQTGAYTTAETDAAIDAMRAQIEAWTAANFVVALYGNLTGPDNPGSFGGAWTPITDYSEQRIAVPRGITLDPVAGTFTIDYPGVYEVAVALTIEGHNSSNGGRVTNARFYDVTGGAPLGAGVAIGIGRNQEDTNATFVVPLELDENTDDHAIRLEIGDGDNVSSIDFLGVSITISGMSEWRQPTGSSGGALSVPPVDYVEEAPEDGNAYARIDGAWQVISEGTAVMTTGENFISRYADTNGDGTGTANAVGDYSSTTTDFKVTAQPGETLSIGRMIVSAEDTSGMAARDYGNIGNGLTNGIEVLVTDDLGATINTLTPAPIKDNAEWAKVCYDSNILTWGPGNELLVVRWTFSKSGAQIELPPGHSVVVRCSDDLTGLVTHNFVIQGYVVT